MSLYFLFSLLLTYFSLTTFAQPYTILSPNTTTTALANYPLSITWTGPTLPNNQHLFFFQLHNYRTDPSLSPPPLKAPKPSTPAELETLQTYTTEYNLTVDVSDGVRDGDVVDTRFSLWMVTYDQKVLARSGEFTIRLGVNEKKVSAEIGPTGVETSPNSTTPQSATRTPLIIVLSIIIPSLLLLGIILLILYRRSPAQIEKRYQAALRRSEKRRQKLRERISAPAYIFSSRGDDGMDRDDLEIGEAWERRGEVGYGRMRGQLVPMAAVRGGRGRRGSV